MEKVYNKLVRDKIPEIIIGNNGKPVTRILSDKEYKIELEMKLLEEYHEVIDAAGSDRIEEIADMLEVMIALAKLEGKTLDELIEVCKDKRFKRGSFEEKIFLEKVLED